MEVGPLVNADGAYNSPVAATSEVQTMNLRHFIVGLIFSSFTSLSASALTLTISGGGVTTTPGAVTFYDFDGIQNTGIGTFTGGVLNFGAPTGTGSWIAAPNGGGPMILNFVNPVSYVGFLWGTADSHNILQVFNGATLLGTYAGVPNIGGQGSTNFVNFTAGAGEDITRLEFLGGYAFESDNYAYIASEAENAVPIPAALPLFATGLGVLTWAARRRKQKNAALAA